MRIKQYTPFESELELYELTCINAKTYVIKPFDVLTIKFLDNLARLILLDKSLNRLPEIVALGFWLRESEIFKIHKEQLPYLKKNIYTVSPLGKVLHICPANVDTMFMYSMVVSLLMGNRNILRISSRINSLHLIRIFKILNQLMKIEEYNIFKEYINIIGYEHNSKISEYLSSNVNGRILWGGDETIRSFQSLQKSPKTKDIVFPDRISIMVLNSKAVLNSHDKEWTLFLRNFFNDVYTFDQMGCSSAQTIFFIGNTTDSLAAQNKILNDFSVYISNKYNNDINSLASLKLNQAVSDAINGNINRQAGNNFFKLLELSKTANACELHGCGGGFFYYRFCSNLKELKNLSVPKVQTITHFGFSKNDLKTLINLSYGEGIDRIVPLGNALNFHYIWDGYNLFHELSRKVYIHKN